MRYGRPPSRIIFQMRECSYFTGWPKPVILCNFGRPTFARSHTNSRSCSSIGDVCVGEYDASVLEKIRTDAQQLERRHRKLKEFDSEPGRVGDLELALDARRTV